MKIRLGEFQTVYSDIAFQGNKVGLLVVLRIYVALAVLQPYQDLEAGDNQSLKFKWRGRELNPGTFATQTKSLTTRPPPLPKGNMELTSLYNFCVQ